MKMEAPFKWSLMSQKMEKPGLKLANLMFLVLCILWVSYFSVEFSFYSFFPPLSPFLFFLFVCLFVCF